MGIIPKFSGRSTTGGMIPADKISIKIIAPENRNPLIRSRSRTSPRRDRPEFTAIENYLYAGFQTPVQFSMKKKVLSAIVMVIWLVLVSVFMLLARQFDLEIFFVLWLIGILVIVELADTRFSLPAYLRYIKYMVAAGIVLFGGIVTLKVLEILAT
jgi:hypothetical protein